MKGYRPDLKNYTKEQKKQDLIFSCIASVCPFFVFISLIFIRIFGEPSPNSLIYKIFGYGLTITFFLFILGIIGKMHTYDNAKNKK